MTIHFMKAAPHHIDLIMSWLNEPHMIEFWDTTQEHKDDILNFIHGRKQTYFGGVFTYWVGYLGQTPYAFVLSEQYANDIKGLPEIHYQHISKTGLTVGLDFGIGNPNFIGKGLAAPTLQAFMTFYRQKEPRVDTFFIDPDPDNSRAFHVYEKAGFSKVGTYLSTQGAFQDQETYLMVKRF